MKRQRWVVKVGSSAVCQGGLLLIRDWMRQVKVLNQHGVEVVWVTSGAIASAVERLHFHKPRAGWTLPEKQALSAMGQPLLMDLYNLALSANAMHGAQVLLTSDDIKDKERRANLHKTLSQLLKWQVLPLLNENDAISNAEIKFGDNDTLSAEVALMIGASRLVILTDVDGLYDRAPHLKRAVLLPEVERVSAGLLKGASVVSRRGSGVHGGGARDGRSVGTGGMETKLKAARLLAKNGIETYLVKGDQPQILRRLRDGEAVGTRIKAKPLPRAKLLARRGRARRSR